MSRIATVDVRQTRDCPYCIDGPCLLNGDIICGESAVIDVFPTDCPLEKKIVHVNSFTDRYWLDKDSSGGKKGDECIGNINLSATSSALSKWLHERDEEAIIEHFSRVDIKALIRIRDCINKAIEGKQ